MLRILLRHIQKLILGWGIIVPISCIVPKKKNLILLVGRNRGKFFGNVKFLYLYLHKNRKSNMKYYFFTEYESVYKTLKKNNLPVIFHPTLLSIYFLLRTNVVVADDMSWRKKYKYHVLFRSKKVQFWHGISLKRVALTIPSMVEYHNSSKGKLHDFIRGKHCVNDLFVSTSEFYTKNVFSKSFRAKFFLESGYPRNDIFFNEQFDKYELLGSDEKVISKVNALRANGYKIILYAPTFRDTGGDAIADGVLDLDNLSEFANKYKVAFVFKFHTAADATYKLEKYNNIIKYDKSKDVQPILKISDVLITDYSSIYMDYLLLDRFIIFFPYDYKKYTQQDRDLLFDYDWITPGPKCCSQDELLKTLKGHITKRKDDFSEKRKEVRRLAFKYQDGKASERVWNFIEERYLK